MAENVGTEPCQPRTVKRQQHRSTIQVLAVFDHYNINIAIPFLDRVISDLDAQLSRMFVKRSFRHIGWISIIRHNFFAISMFIIATSIFTALHVTAASLLGFVPSVVCTQQVDLTEVVGLYEHDIPSTECVYQEPSR